jgi:uncharacterized hydrophobic protein (TIGR00271 family)
VFVMRALTAPVRTDEVVATLGGIKGVSGIVVGGPTRDSGLDVVTADVMTDAADEMFARLLEVGIDADAVTLVRQSTVGAVARLRAGRWFTYGENTLVWAEAVDTARENATLTARYCLYMVAAGVIATFGIVLRNPILIVGAMAVSPDLMPLSAFAIGLVGGRPRLAVRGLVVLLIGMVIAGVSAAVLSWALWKAGAYGGVLSTSDALSGLVGRVSSDTVIVALAAGVVGMLAFETRASTAVGVAISVTTIPAVAFAGVAAGIGDYAQGEAALLVLLVNVVMLFAGSALTLMIQRRVGRRFA